MNRITEFVDSFIPKNISKKKASILKEELICHIMDKVDYYKDIGYDDTESVNKAIEDFGTDEVDKKFIFNEFEELYSEKSIFGILAFVIIAVMNFICAPLDLWVTSADFNRDPDPFSAFISFAMIFIVLIMIAFARIKKYRKTLISIGIVNTLIAVVLLMSFYPQMAAFTLAYDIIYLVDNFTPFSIGNIIVMAHDGILAMALWVGILIIPSLYCFTEAFRIKQGRAKQVKKPKKKIAIFSSVFFTIAIASCLLYPTSEKYADNYPVWFDNYYNYISDESEKMFDEISIHDKYNEVDNHLSFAGYVTVEQYRDSLDRVKRKQFNQNLKEFDFAEGYEIWFKPGETADGNGFIGIKQENGIITGKAIGNIEEKMYSEKNNNFGYSSYKLYHNMFAMFDYFRTLKKGDAEADVMSRFGSEFGFIYAKRSSVEDGKKINYYRIYFHGITNPEGKSYEKGDSRYIELTFENGVLVNGTMYDKEYLDKGSEVKKENIN